MHNLPRPPLSLPVAYAQAVRASARRDDGAVPEPAGYEVGEWNARVVRGSRRLLSAVCFREAAEDTRRTTGGVLLPTVGFYYALFHMGAAALYFDYATPLGDLQQLKHKRLRNLLEAKLVARRLLPRGYVRLLAHLQRRREYVNYVVGGKLPDEPYHLAAEAATWYRRTAAAFGAVERFARAVMRVVDPGPESMLRVQVTVADNIGDDLTKFVLSPPQRARVARYLVRRGLTT